MSSRHLLLTTGTLIAAAALALPATATAGSVPGSTTQGSPTVSEINGMFTDLVLSGTCPDQTSDLKNVVTTPLQANAWAPIHLLGPDFADIGKQLLPYQITVSGEGLKARHAIPGLPYTRLGPAPAKPVTCFFEGATKEGAFQVTVIGTIRTQPRCGRHPGRPAVPDPRGSGPRR